MSFKYFICLYNILRLKQGHTPRWHTETISIYCSTELHSRQFRSWLTNPCIDILFARFRLCGWYYSDSTVEEAVQYIFETKGHIISFELKNQICKKQVLRLNTNISDIKLPNRENSFRTVDTCLEQRRMKKKCRQAIWLSYFQLKKGNKSLS